jgi:hypothetical protein
MRNNNKENIYIRKTRREIIIIIQRKFFLRNNNNKIKEGEKYKENLEKPNNVNILKKLENKFAI